MRKKKTLHLVTTFEVSEEALRWADDLGRDHLRVFLIEAQRTGKNRSTALLRYLEFRRLGGPWLAEAMPLVERLDPGTVTDRDILWLGLEYLHSQTEPSKARAVIEKQMVQVMSRLSGDQVLVGLARDYLARRLETQE